MDWIKASGKIEVNNGVRIATGIDICKYYNSFIKRELKINPQLPLYGAHVTLASEKVHNLVDFSAVLDYHGRSVEFLYSPQYKTGDVNFWLPVSCKIYHEIKWILGFNERYNWRGLHLTISNLKYERKLG